MAGQVLRLLLIIAIALAWSMGQASPVWAAAPTLIMVYGHPMTEQVIPRDWQSNAAVIGGERLTEMSMIEPEGRPHLELALFWGPRWVEYVEDDRPLADLRPEHANQHGRFYPAVGSDAALIVLEHGRNAPTPIIQVGPEGLAILARHDVPVRTKSALCVPGSVVPSP